MKWIDDEGKSLKWYNRNIFYVGTLFVVLFLVLAYALGKGGWVSDYDGSSWTAILSFQNVTVCFLSAFEHSNWQHCLLNALCFLIAGTYMERKIGTVNLLALTFALAFFCECAVDANGGRGSHGFSGVNYGMYAYIIVDYLFLFLRKKQNRVSIIYGAIILALIYLACCFCGGTEKIAFQWYPHDLISNKGHYTSFLTGGIMALLVQFIAWQSVKEKE